MFLDCISLLARHTDQTFDELLNCLEQGKLLQMAVLFVAAHKQIRAITCQDTDGKSMTAMEVILRRIDDVILFMNRETGEIRVKPKNGFSL
uniref:Bushy growth protein n=1 Tax=Rhizophora mucronata TaxID=61149 RepID=A0A2P2L8R7_RHIMU